MTTLAQPYIESFRPKAFDEIIGSKNKSISTIIENKLKEGNLERALLLNGTTGCGKTTLALIVAKMTTSEPSIDITEINCSTKTGIDVVRELEETYHLSPMGGTKTIILDEVHNLSRQAQDGLLKLIERVPPRTRFILCTDSPEKLDKAILGRCTQYRVERPEDKDIFNRLKEISKKKNITISDDAITSIVKKSPNVRKAINNLESLVGIGEITSTVVNTIIEADIDENSNYFALTSILLWPSMHIKNTEPDPLNIWETISPKIKEALEKNQPQQLGMGLAGYCRNRLLDQAYKYKKDGSEKNIKYQIQEFKRLHIILEIFSKDIFTAKPENQFCSLYFKAIVNCLKVK